MTEWKNRITGYGTEAPDQLLANPHNHRIHPRRQQDALSGSLDTLGYIQTVIVNKASGHIIDGHLRVNMALREGQSEIPVTYVELSEAEEAQALLSLDPIAAMAASDAEKVDELLRMIQTDDERVMQHLADLAKENGLDYGQAEQGDAEPQIDRAAELLEKWKVQPGDLWQIGEHRLICGDCTDKATVEKVMQGEKADLGFADPPYNAGVDEWDKDFIWQHDWLIDLCTYVIVTPGISAAADFMKATNMPYKWTLAAYISNGYARSAVGFGWWMYAPLFSSESIFRQKPDAVEIALETGQANGEHHRGQKPPKFMEWIIGLYGENVVFDCFCGSGTTLVSCENLGKKARAIEINPAYCAVALERMSQAFPALEIRRLSESSR